MPTRSERRALLFLAAVGALGVAARGWNEVRRAGDDSAGDRAGLDSQIAAADSAVAADRARRASRRPRNPASGSPPSARTPRGSAQERHARPNVADAASSPRDPRELYLRRREEADSINARAQRTLAAEAAAAAARATARAPALAASSPVVPTTVSAAHAQPPRVDLDVAGAAEIAGLPWIGEVLAARIVDDRARRGPFGSLDGLQRVRGIGPRLAERLAPFVTFSGRPASSGATVIPLGRIRVRPPKRP